MDNTFPLTVKITGPTLLKEALGALLGKLQGFSLWNELDGTPDLILALVASFDKLRAAMIMELHPHSRVLLLSIIWNPEDAVQAFQAGAAGILTTDFTAGELAAALRQAARGEIVLSTDLQKAIVLEMARSPATPITISFESLSERERDVLVLICQGLSNKQIAQQLYLSVRTVENHLRRLYQKLGVSSRTEAAVLAMQERWVELD